MSEYSSAPSNVSRQNKASGHTVTPRRPNPRPLQWMPSSNSSIKSSFSEDLWDAEESQYSTPLTSTSSFGSQIFGKSAEPTSPESPSLQRSTRLPQSNVANERIKTEEDEEDPFPKRIIRGSTFELEQIEKTELSSYRLKIEQSYTQPTEYSFDNFEFSSIALAEDQERAHDKPLKTENKDPGVKTSDDKKPVIVPGESIEVQTRHLRGPHQPPSISRTRTVTARLVNVEGKLGETVQVEVSEVKIEQGTKTKPGKETVQTSVRGKVSKIKLDEKKLAGIIPFNIRERLSMCTEQHKCIAILTKPPRKPCGNQALGPLEGVEENLEKLHEHHKDKNYKCMYDCIESVINSVYCKKAHRWRAVNRLEAVWAHFSIENGRNFDIQAALPIDQLVFNQWLAAVSIQRLKSPPIGVTAIKHEPAPEAILTKKKIEPIITVSEVTDVDTEEVTEEFPLLPPGIETVHLKPENKVKPLPTVSHYGIFTAYQPNYTFGIPVNIALRNIVAKPLNMRERKSGYIYMFWHKPDFGYVKIGVTTRDTRERLQQWVKQCGEIFELFRESDTSNVTFVKHVYRIEALIHTELKERRAQITDCAGCKTKHHREWFNVGALEATAVFKKWSEWMENSPYEKFESEGKNGKKVEEWKLKSSIAASQLMDLCGPVALQNAMSTPNKAKSKRDRRSFLLTPRKSIEVMRTS